MAKCKCETRCRIVRRAILVGALSLSASAARSSWSDELPRSLDFSKLVDQSLRLVRRPGDPSDRAADDAARRSSDVEVPSDLTHNLSFDLASAWRAPVWRRATKRRDPIDALPLPLDIKRDPLRPRTAVVARDWGGALALHGRGVATDDVRLSRSSRMVLGRVLLGDGTFVPFAHVGAGQWRYDPEVLPFMPRNQEYATQVAGGVEVRLSPNAAIVWEADYTVLCRERREPQNVPQPHLLGTFAVLATKF